VLVTGDGEESVGIEYDIGKFKHRLIEAEASTYRTKVAGSLHLWGHVGPLHLI